MFINLAQNYLTRGFWGDEAWTSLISQLPYSQMLWTTAHDFHPPGYYTIIELLYKFFPPTEIITRSVSIVFYFATIFMVYLLAKKMRGQTFGLVSCLVAALNPIFFKYAFEARNYTMFAFAATASCYFLLKLSKKFNLKDAVYLTFFSSLGIYTHYYMFFILASQGLYLLLFDRKIFWKSVLCYIVVALSFLPWIPFLFGQLSSVSQGYWIGAINSRTYLEAFQRILSGEQDNIFRQILFALTLILLGLSIWQHLVKRKFEKPYLLIWLWAVIPFLLASLPGLKIGEFKFPLRPIFFWRYLIGSSVPLSMIIVYSAQKLPSQFFKLSIGAVIVLSLCIDYLTFVSYPYGFKQVYQEKIVGQIKPQEKIVTVLPSFAEVLYYKNRNNLKNELIVLNEGLVQFSGKSLLDSYEKLGIVKIGQAPISGYYNLEQGPTFKYIK